MFAEPRVEFPLKKELVGLYNQLGYYIQLMHDWEELINAGMEPVEAERYIKMLADKNYDLRVFRA